MHIVLVDNGPTRMLEEEGAEMRRCIRCRPCMNLGVVFRQIGGHAYGGANLESPGRWLNEDALLQRTRNRARTID
jgi:L-lactate utilization protein LutB